MFIGGKMSAIEIKKNFDELADRVKDAEGCLSPRMGELRDLIQAGRLDSGPINHITHNLEQAGLAAIPLTRSQYDWTLVYAKRSVVGRVIIAAQGGGQHSADDLRKGVKKLAALNSAERDELATLRAALDQIKALVSET
jgi:hypothetical protein